MARPSHEFSPTVDAEIRMRRARGESAQAVAAAIGQPDKARTIGRKYPQAGGPAKAPRSPRKREPLAVKRNTRGEVTAVAWGETDPAGPPPLTDFPDGVDPETVEHWIKRTERMAAVAEARGETGAYGTLMARLVALMEHRRKSTPIEKQDPNENPDMLAAREQARVLFHKLIDAVLAERAA